MHAPPPPPPLSKAIMVPRDTVLETPRLQQLAMIFDHILVWPSERQKLPAEQLTIIQDELNFLAAEKVVLRCGIDIPSFITFGLSNGTEWDPFSAFKENCEIIIPCEYVKAAEQLYDGETNADRIIRGVSSIITCGDAPVAADTHIQNMPTTHLSEHAVRMTLRQLPVPPADLPWQDLLQFRKDSETVQHLRRLRLWLQRQARTAHTAQEMEDELASLLYEYRSYMKLQHKKFGEGVISTVLVASLDAATNLLNLRAGDALKSLIDFNGKALALREAELLAPGRDVAYLANAHESQHLRA